MTSVIRTCPRCGSEHKWDFKHSGFCCPDCMMEWDLPQTLVRDDELAALREVVAEAKRCWAWRNDEPVLRQKLESMQDAIEELDKVAE